MSVISHRAVEMLRIAAQYIRDNASTDETVRYDGVECDGFCVAEDCDSAADALESERPHG